MKGIASSVIRFDGILRALFKLLVVAFAVLPFLWLLISSFKPVSELFSPVPRLIIDQPTFEHYVWSFGRTGANLAPYLRNTVIITIGSILLTVALSAFAGYSISRYRFPGRWFVVVLLVFSQMFQGPSIMVAWYRMAHTLGILNTHLVLVLIYCTQTIPVASFLFAGYVRSIPIEIEEAGLIDGANRVTLLRRIVIPLLRPFVVAVAIYTAIIAWNDYQYSLVLTSSRSAQNVQVALANLMQSMGSQNWGGIMASAVIVTLPVVIFFTLVQGRLVTGLTQGAGK